MTRCVIIAPLYDGCELSWTDRREGDLILCADGGYRAAMAHGIHPDELIGDFDSMPFPEDPDCRVTRLPVHKDDTDLEVCFSRGWEKGYRVFLVLGALGGRLDHTLAALQSARRIAEQGGSVTLADARNRITILTPGEYPLKSFHVPGKKLSVLAASDTVTGVELTGTEWTLHNAVLKADYPLGVSNEVTGDPMLSFQSGILYVISSAD